MDYATHYAEYHRTDREYFETWSRQNRDVLARLVGPVRSDPILDVGCGYGLLVYALKSLGYEDVSGIDVDASQIQVAAGHGLPCQRVPIEEQAAYFAARQGHHRVITLFDVLEHVPVAVQVEFLQTLRGSLKPGGRLIIQTPNASSPIAGHMRYIDHTHTSSFTGDSLRYILRSAGFDEVAIQEAEMSAPAGLGQPMRLLRKAGGRMARWLWRVIYLGEFGRPGMAIPLSRNLLAIGTTRTP